MYILLYLQNFDIFIAIILSFDVFENDFNFFYIYSIYYSMLDSFSFNFFMFRLYYYFVFGTLFIREFDYEKSDIFLYVICIYNLNICNYYKL
jgi:hypothetical protein